MIDRDLPLKKEIAKNIKELLKKNDLNQIKLSELTGISKSTLSDYLNCKTLINISNVEKMAAALNVEKSRIDPSFETQKELSIKEKTIETIAAHIDDDVTEEEMEVIKNYIDFIKSQRKK
ncbi:helix-turn-helix transcriptional regulator [Viridibacillus sp. FSL R5-0477]|uniref:CI-like repressor n=1 Tax=Viridibacillus arenosi FSL R5-213 TaxID=1227360 RepID=W4ER83_9BACL|nr:MULTISPECIES: helix-turn-helix transcriptional regulator [Viridibacillus]ETT82502.1 cI-like repressor [Viridibacillus arenosi FSL R5-213]OMC85472.1 transcriptional regulator [Viridibacillus sp. FSL H8-0123]OMC87250.1 transcriptional regulator [Viridibacillus sp. FSL H7-0596]OMC92411.1 transcriptional regulator [Viridibacillus arenosi]